MATDCPRISCCGTGPFNDLKYSLVNGQTYGNDEITITVPCPPGFICANPFVNITLPPNTVTFTPTVFQQPSTPGIPPETPGEPQPGVYEFNCGGETLSMTVAATGWTTDQITQVLDFLSQCAAQIEGQNQNPATPRNTLLIGNTEQCYTARCPEGETGDPVTVCISAGTYTEELPLNASQNQINRAQSRVNSQALTAATQQAKADIVCAGFVCPEVLATGTFLMSNTNSIAYVPDNQKVYAQDLSASVIRRVDPDTLAIEASTSVSVVGPFAFVGPKTLMRTTSANFNAPSIGATVVVPVSSVAFVTVGAAVTVGGSVHYEVTAIDDFLGQLTLENVDDTPSTLWVSGTSLQIAWPGGILVAMSTGPAIHLVDPVTMANVKMVDLSAAPGFGMVFFGANGDLVVGLQAGSGFDTFNIASGSSANHASPFPSVPCFYNQVTGQLVMMGYSGGNFYLHSLNLVYGIVNSYGPITNNSTIPAINNTQSKIYYALTNTQTSPVIQKIQTLVILNAATLGVLQTIQLNVSGFNIAPYAKAAYDTERDLFYVAWETDVQFDMVTDVYDPATDTVRCQMPDGLIGTGVNSTANQKFYSINRDNNRLVAVGEPP